MTDHRRTPTDFLPLAREMRAGWDDADAEPINPALADQMQAANRDARRLMGESLEHVIDVDGIGVRELALMFALTAAADRRGLHSTQDPSRPRPEVVNLDTAAAASATSARPGRIGSSRCSRSTGRTSSAPACACAARRFAPEQSRDEVA